MSNTISGRNVSGIFRTLCVCCFISGFEASVLELNSWPWHSYFFSLYEPIHANACSQTSSHEIQTQCYDLVLPLAPMYGGALDMQEEDFGTKIGTAEACEYDC